MVDASIVEVPSLTKNRSGERDAEMRQTKKGNQWHFGMKMHVGADAETGMSHSFAATAANESDVAHAHRLPHGGGKRVRADAGCQRVDKREENKGRGVDWRVAMRPGLRRRLEADGEEARREKEKVPVGSVRNSVCGGHTLENTDGPPTTWEPTQPEEDFNL